MGQDTWQGNLLEPLTRNLYVYTTNNPLTYVDPSGHAQIAGAGGGCGNDLKCKEAISQGLTYSAGRASSNQRSQPVPLLLRPETYSPLQYGFSPQSVYYWGPDLLSGFLSTGFSSSEVYNLNAKVAFRLKTDPSHTFYDYSDSIFADRLLSFELYFVPGVGLFKAAQEAATGVDLITGEDLRTRDRVLLGAAAAVPFVPRLIQGAKSLPRLTSQAGFLKIGGRTETAISKAYHYTSARNAASIAEEGLVARGGVVYATPRGSLSPLQAQIDLALRPNRPLPTPVFEIDLNAVRAAGIEVSDPRLVARWMNMPGGGQEILIYGHVPPQFLRRVR